MLWATGKSRCDASVALVLNILRGTEQSWEPPVAVQSCQIFGGVGMAMACRAEERSKCHCHCLREYIGLAGGDRNMNFTGKGGPKCILHLRPSLYGLQVD